MKLFFDRHFLQARNLSYPTRDMRIEIVKGKQIDVRAKVVPPQGMRIEIQSIAAARSYRSAVSPTGCVD